MTTRFDPITDLIVARLEADAELDALVARTVFGDQDTAAVYAVQPPVTATLPYVYVPAGSETEEPDNPATNARFRDIQREVHFYAPRPTDGGGNPRTVMAMVKRGFALFDEIPLVLDGTGLYARNLLCRVSGPLLNDGPNAFGRILTLHLRTQTAVEA